MEASEQFYLAKSLAQCLKITVIIVSVYIYYEPIWLVREYVEMMRCQKKNGVWCLYFIGLSGLSESVQTVWARPTRHLVYCTPKFDQQRPNLVRGYYKSTVSGANHNVQQGTTVGVIGNNLRQPWLRWVVIQWLQIMFVWSVWPRLGTCKNACT